MNLPMFFFFLILTLVLFYIYRDLWIRPDSYLEKNKQKRIAYYDSVFGIPLFFNILKLIDKYPQIDLWFSRIVFLLLVAIYFFGMIAAIMNIK